MEEKYYIGTDLKFLINIEAEGFSMDSDDYEIELRCNSRSVTVHKEDIVEDGEDHYLCVDSTQFGSGMLQMVVYAYVPDEHFLDDHTRTEIAVVNLCELRKTYGG